jgi:DNA mismatch repair ATPase MutS
MHHAEDSSHISQRLEVGRKALETLASIASQLESAKDGLIRSAYLTSNIEELPPAIRRLWESLDKNIMAMSATELRAELLQLEQHLSVRMIWLTPFIEKICAEETLSDDARIRDVRLQMQDMARLAGTALAIRVLAHRKHYKFPPSEMPVRADELREKAQRVKKIERVHKLRVITHMREMTKATTSMLKLPSLDTATRTMLKSVLNDLQLNAKHLANGGSFASLPAPIEEVEMTEPEMEAANDLNLVATSPADPEVEQESVEHIVSSPAPAVAAKLSNAIMLANKGASLAASSPVPAVQPLRTAPAREQSIKPSAITHTPRAPSRFFKQLYVWVKSPMNVTWSEARLMIADADDL